MKKFLMMVLFATTAMAMNDDQPARSRVTNRIIIKDGKRVPVALPLQIALHAKSVALQGNSLNFSMPFWGVAAPHRLLPLPSLQFAQSPQSTRAAIPPLSSIPTEIPIGEIAPPTPGFLLLFL